MHFGLALCATQMNKNRYRSLKEPMKSCIQIIRLICIFVLVISDLAPIHPQELPDWSLPIKLGDSMSTIFTVLGKPITKTRWESALAIKWFPDSGMVVWYDTLTMKVYQIGINCIDSHHFRSYKNDVFRGLTVTDTIDKWKAILGTPSSITKVSNAKNLFCYKWKTKSYILTVETWINGFSDKNGFHSKGSIASVVFMDLVNNK